MMVLIDKAHADFPPLDCLSSRSIASRMSAIFFLKGEQFLGVLKLQAKARILALKALLLMTDLAVSLRFIFWRKRWMNSQAPSTPVWQVRRKRPSRLSSSPMTGTRLQSHPL